MIQFVLNWNDMKRLLDENVYSWRYEKIGGKYEIFVVDHPIVYRISLPETGNANTTDFINNYAINQSGTISKAPFGWMYRNRFLSLETNVQDSLTNQNSSGQAYSDATMSISSDGDYQVTRVDFQPTFDYAIVGGGIYYQTAPALDLFCFSVQGPGVVDHPFMENINLKNHSNYIIQPAKGSIIKYDPLNNTSVIRFVFRHKTIQNGWNSHKLDISLITHQKLGAHLP